MTLVNEQRMEALFSGIKGGALMVFGMYAAYIPINFFGTASLSENSTVELKTVATVAVFGGSIVWWLARKFQKIDDRLEALENNKHKEDE